MNKKHVNTRTRKMGFPAVQDEFSLEKKKPCPVVG